MIYLKPRYTFKEIIVVVDDDDNNLSLYLIYLFIAFFRTIFVVTDDENVA